VEARTRFLEARTKFLEDSREGAAFRQIVREFPDDPIAPWAELYAGMAAVKSRQYAEADRQLTRVIAANPNEGVATKARLYLGISKNYQGDTAAARRLLAGADRAVETDDERTEYLAALAYSLAEGEEPLAALPVFDLLWPRVNPTERAAALTRIEALVTRAAPPALQRSYDALDDRRGPSIAIVGTRLASIFEAEGNAGAAAKRREDIAPARAAVGLPPLPRGSEVGDVNRSSDNAVVLGAVIPGAAKDRVVSDAVTAGLGVAATLPDGKGAIEIRSAIDKLTAVEKVEELAARNVLAIVGPVGDSMTDAAAARAEGLGVPLISLSPHAEGRTSGRFVFYIRHSPEARAAALAERGLGLRIKRYALLGPDSDYGKGATSAFASAIAKGGGSVVATVLYPRDTISFTKIVGGLGAGFDGVFVADEASKLALIAPALAAGGAIPKPTPLPKTVRGGHPILLLSTADDLTADFLARAGRHTEGALLAPGFFPDDTVPEIQSFVTRYAAEYGRPPGATAAYAFDAASIAMAARASERTGLASAFSSGGLSGVTGTIRFDPQHRRADPGVLYTVVDEGGNRYAIRAVPAQP
jgi:ABC-type branched-subunit amino acid transport system substrate-binding protein